MEGEREREREREKGKKRKIRESGWWVGEHVCLCLCI